MALWSNGQYMVKCGLQVFTYLRRPNPNLCMQNSWQLPYLHDPPKIFHHQHQTIHITSSQSVAQSILLCDAWIRKDAFYTSWSQLGPKLYTPPPTSPSDEQRDDFKPTTTTHRIRSQEKEYIGLLSDIVYPTGNPSSHQSHPLPTEAWCWSIP
jgi:hypothetical protein